MFVERNLKVSIIIPVYNGSNYLSEAIDSALAQTYKNIEIIVVNDGSCDNGATEKIAKSYGEKIRYFSKNNGGVSSALNLGIQKMTGEYFSWLSHDDMYSVDKIKHSVELLKRHNQIGKKCIAFTGGYFIDSSDKKICNFRTYFKENHISSGNKAVEIMSKKGILNGCCMLIPKVAFSEVGMFDENLRYSQDALMWYLLFLNGYDICYTASADVCSRVHKHQVTSTRKDLFYSDSFYIVEILSPLFLNVDNSKKIFYNYVKRLTRLNCPKTVNYMVDFAKNNGVFGSRDVLSLRFERAVGKVVSKIKKIIRNIVSR